MEDQYILHLSYSSNSPFYPNFTEHSGRSVWNIHTNNGTTVLHGDGNFGKPPGAHLRMKCSKFYGAQGFITVFTSVLSWSLSRARWIQYIPPHPITLRSILKLSSHLRLVLPSGLFPSCFPTKIVYVFLYSSFMLHALYISSFLIWSLQLYLAKRVSYKVLHQEISSNFLLFHPTSVQILSSARSSQIPSVYVFSLLSEIKFHTHTKLQVK
jgi:hypothetical protein